MPRTEAGKRLLENGDAYTYTRAVLADQIDAIEAEACHHDARWIEQFTAWCVAAERARIRAAVEGMPSSRHVVGYREGTVWVKCVAVLAIIDQEDTDAHD